jgi:pyruvate, orthophosphate dikinase
MREMILADKTEIRKQALAKLLPYQRDDFKGHLHANSKGSPGYHPVPGPAPARIPAARRHRAASWLKNSASPSAIICQRVKELHEFNPMLGFRGCRLGITYPEISEMQARAVFEAAAAVQKKGIKVKPEIMIPLVGFKRELELQVELVHRVAREVMKEQKVKLKYLVGTMIEVPRGALTADEIAQTAEFFSFGTNDLTQTCLGMSRDDSGSFLPRTRNSKSSNQNPFASIDQTGVGNSWKWPSPKAAKPGPTSNSASAANTAVIPPASSSVTAPDSTT